MASSQRRGPRTRAPSESGDDQPPPHPNAKAERKSHADCGPRHCRDRGHGRPCGLSDAPLPHKTPPSSAWWNRFSTARRRSKLVGRYAGDVCDGISGRSLMSWLIRLSSATPSPPPDCCAHSDSLCHATAKALVEPDDPRFPGGPILTTDECQGTAGLRQQIEAQLMELDAWMEALRWTSTIPKPDGTVDETLKDMIYSLNDPPCRAGFCHARGAGSRLLRRRLRGGSGSVPHQPQPHRARELCLLTGTLAL